MAHATDGANQKRLPAPSMFVVVALLSLGLSAPSGPVLVDAFLSPQPHRVIGDQFDSSPPAGGRVTRQAVANPGGSDDGGGGDGGAPAGQSPFDSPRRRQRRRRRQERRAAAAAGGITPEGNLLADSPDGPASLIDAGANAAAFGAMLEEGGLAAEEEKVSDPDLQETLRGGPSLIFAMARRMLVWDDESYVGQNDTYRPDAQSRRQKADPSVDAGAGAAAFAATAPPQRQSGRPPVLPRWHPHPGISDVNPSFRQRAPVMNNAGYLGAIRRNARKRSKPSLWRYSLRVYDRMRQIEAEQARADETGTAKRKLRIKRTRGHHEGALVACAKLGLWREALRIYGDVVEEEKTAVSVAAGGGAAMGKSVDGATKAAIRRKVRQKGLGISDGMILGLVRACVRGSKAKTTTSGEGSSSGGNKPAKRGREPLDAARDVLLSLEEEHGLFPEPRYVNPLAAAYQSLGLRSEASELLRRILPDRPKLVPPSRKKKKKKKSGAKLMNDPAVILNADDDISPTPTKDRASYSLLVGGAVADEDWEGAVEALRDMTESGLYPTGRALNAWSEASEGSAGERNGRSRRSWRRRRDEYWLESLR